MRRKLSASLQTLFVLTLLLAARPCRAGFEVETHEVRSYLLAGIEASQLTSPLSTTSGIGPRVSYEYFFSPSWSAEPGISMVFGSSSTKLLYSELEGNVQYSIFGAPLIQKTIVKLNGTDRVETTNPSPSRLALSAGIMQVFLNGLQNVFPASGVGFGLVYSHSLFKLPLLAELRYSALSSNSQSIKGAMLRVSLFFDL